MYNNYMVKINSNNNLNILSSDDNKPKDKEKKSEDKNISNFSEKDKLNISTKKDNISNNVFSDSEKDKGKGWKIKSVHVNAGYLVENDVIHTNPMRIVNPNNNSDFTISGYEQTDRKSWEHLTMKNGTRFAPDEPQFVLGVNATFENNFGVELDAKHHKIIMNGYDQNVNFNGVMHGNNVNFDAPLNTFMSQHEQTLGNMQISLLGTYTKDLPSPDNHKFSFITKAGPSMITANTRSTIKEPDGTVNHNTSPLKVVGYGATVENGLRYQFGDKAKNIGLELTHSLSYLNFASYPLVGGYTANHSAINSSFALKATIPIYNKK